MLSRAKQVEYYSVTGGPCARRRIAAANEVMNEIDMMVPMDPGLGVAAPAFVAGLTLVLRNFFMFPGNDQICRLEHGIHAHFEQPVEIDCPQGIIDADRYFFLQDYRAFVQTVGGTEDGQTGLGLALDDRPIDRAGAAVLGQQRRMVLNGAMSGDVNELLRGKLQHEGHDADFGVRILHRLRRLGQAQ